MWGCLPLENEHLSQSDKAKAFGVGDFSDPNSGLSLSRAESLSVHGQGSDDDNYDSITMMVTMTMLTHRGCSRRTC